MVLELIRLIFIIIILYSLKLKAFSKFENTTDALSAATAIVEGKVSKNLKKFLQNELSEKDIKEKLAVSDSKLGMFLIINFNTNHKYN